MKAKTLGALSVLGMLLSGVSAYSLTPTDGLAAAADIRATDDDDTDRDEDDADEDEDESRAGATFQTGSTLAMEGRLGHATLVGGRGGETYLMLQVDADAQKRATGAAAPVNLSIVIDRSGSMKGNRMLNAQKAAMAAVDRLGDGDVVSVVTFDTRTEMVVPPTTISSVSRESVKSAVRAIQLGGDTCISCGVDEGLRALTSTAGKVDRMIVLSDGDANTGVRDVPGFQALARRSLEQGVSITTIGVDLTYNQAILSAIARDSNGNHYFVENETGLPRVFEAEAESLKRTVASEAVATLALAPGVSVEEVLGRTFTRSGDTINVPLGSFSSGETKTVLVKLRVQGDPDEVLDVADVRLSYDDLSTGQRVSDRGTLALRFTDDASEASLLDPIVLARVQRAETANALREANELFTLGKADEARQRLIAEQQQVQARRQKAKAAAPAKRATALDDDFGRQANALDEASSGFATPPPGAAPSPAAPRAVRKNAEVSNAFDF